jgi:hypothetical protein
MKPQEQTRKVTPKPDWIQKVEESFTSKILLE